MSNYGIDFVSKEKYGIRKECIEYTDGSKKLHIKVLFRDMPSLKLRDIEHWDKPNENENISIEEKKVILKRIEENLILRGWNKQELNFDFSHNTAFFTHVDIFERLKSCANMKKNNLDNYSVSFDCERIEENSYRYYRLNETEKKQFKLLLIEDFNIENETKEKYINGRGWVIENNYKLKNYLIGFTKWIIKVKEESYKQNNFTCGLYALDMVLTEDNREEIKEILKQYVKVSKEKNLSFEEFMIRNRPLNEIINELLSKEN